MPAVDGLPSVRIAFVTVASDLAAVASCLCHVAFAAFAAAFAAASVVASVVASSELGTPSSVAASYIVPVPAASLQPHAIVKPSHPLPPLQARNSPHWLPFASDFPPVLLARRQFLLETNHDSRFKIQDSR